MLYAYTFLQFLSEIEFSVCRAGLRQTKRSVTKLVAEEKVCQRNSKCRAKVQRAEIWWSSTHKATKERDFHVPKEHKKFRHPQVHRSRAAEVVGAEVHNLGNSAVQKGKKESGVHWILAFVLSPFTFLSQFPFQKRNLPNQTSEPHSESQFWFLVGKVSLEWPLPKNEKE